MAYLGLIGALAPMCAGALVVATLDGDAGLWLQLAGFRRLARLAARGFCPLAPRRTELTASAITVPGRDGSRLGARGSQLDQPNSMPWARGRSVDQFTVTVWRRM